MAAAVAISPVSGSITAKLTACQVSCSGVSNNDSGAFDSTKYPTEPQILYYFKLSASGQPTLKSNPFSTNKDGKAEWHNVLFPAAGSWTLDLNKVTGDSNVVTAAVTVN